MTDQRHPQYKADRDLLTSILKDGTPSDFNLAEVARLRIRYDGFPGARDIQVDLDGILQTWNLSETDLFAKTRAIHQEQTVYRERFSKRDDWA
ncbi:DUF3288 family protein [Synechococcus sp. PCC 7336]|uniref:DUF3288 family protein n=1 Tax=Synechococcus sp. PCC 7336 TaxID=195250 RepID=UPI0003499EE7|nr:DUF3288 family protein [Synechococcus sp. PCC 7336]